MFAGAAPDSTLTQVRTWRTQHEMAILRELFDLLSLPNVATNQGDMARNADALTQMLARRRFTAEILPTSGSPVVLAERRAPNAVRTLTFYFHYDGQPVDPREWTHGPPFTPVVVTGPAADARTLTLAQLTGPIDGEWRIYGRSSSDDKSPIVAFLAAIDALDASARAADVDRSRDPRRRRRRPGRPPSTRSSARTAIACAATR